MGGATESHFKRCIQGGVNICGHLKIYSTTVASGVFPMYDAQNTVPTGSLQNNNTHTHTHILKAEWWVSKYN